MKWIKPKTNWKSSDYFNLDPDYTRIKGNIEYLFDIEKSAMIPMKEYTVSDDALPGFFNSIVGNIESLAASTLISEKYVPMKSYIGNGRIWTEKDLNTIENNTILLYNAIKGQENLLPKLAFELGGSEF